MRKPALTNQALIYTRLTRLSLSLCFLWLALALSSCRQTSPEAPRVAVANVNTNAPAAASTPAPVALNTNSAMPPASVTPVAPLLPPNPTTAPAGQAIPAREPEQYRATLTLKIAGQPPILTADVSRNGTDRRLDFTLPDGRKLTYLYQTDRLFLILPDKKLYAVQDGAPGRYTLPSTLDPERLSEQLRADARYQPAGEEKFNRRTAAKYRYLGAESFVYLDKEMSLPLHVEMAQPKPGGNGEFILTTIELNNVTADIPLKHFNEPRDMQEVDLAQMQDIFQRVLQLAAGRK